VVVAIKAPAGGGTRFPPIKGEGAKAKKLDLGGGGGGFCKPPRGARLLGGAFKKKRGL